MSFRRITAMAMSAILTPLKMTMHQTINELAFAPSFLLNASFFALRSATTSLHRDNNEVSVFFTPTPSATERNTRINRNPLFLLYEHFLARYVLCNVCVAKHASHTGARQVASAL